MKLLRAVCITLISISFACGTDHSSVFSPASYIPEESNYIFSTSNLRADLDKLSETTMINAISKAVSNLQSRLNFLKFTKNNSEAILAMEEFPAGPFLLITAPDTSFIQLDSVQVKSVETLTIDGKGIKKFEIGETAFFQHQDHNRTLISDSQSYLLSSIDNENAENDAFTSLISKADPDRLNIFIKNTSNPYGVWSILDFDISENTLALSGIVSSFNDASEKTAKNFSFNTEKAIPATVNQFKTSKPEFKKDSSLSIHQFNSIKEISTFRINGDAAVIHADSIELISEAFSENATLANTYREIDIFELKSESLPFKNANYKYFSSKDELIFMSEVLGDIEAILSAYLSESAMANSARFQSLKTHTSSQSSFLSYGKPKNLYPEITAMIDSKNAIFQLVEDAGFYHVHGYFSNSEVSEKTSNTTSQQLTFSTEKPVVVGPFYFRNHRTDQMDIALQDDENTLYLISNKGNIHWKKKLKSRITGDIHQVDLFKNGYYQLAFSTGNTFEVIDRTGKPVKPFPTSFNNNFTQPASIFDYDNNRNYRFVLTQNKSIYMVGPRGKTIKGFDFEKAGSDVTLSPKHIRLGTKDYILISEDDGNLNILSRQGNVRVPFNQKINLGENDWHGYDDQFVTITETGDLIAIDQNGKQKALQSGLAETAKLNATENLLVVLNENQLHINSKNVELDYGLYLQPQIFLVNNKYYISVTDKQAEKVYVFDSQAKLLSGFPVYGTSTVDISNADTDNAVELIVLGGTNEVIVYEF